MKVSLQDQLKCVKREAAMRRNVYPKWVASGKWTQEQANREIAAMDAVVETIQRRLSLAVEEGCLEAAADFERVLEQKAKPVEMKQEQLI